MKRYARLIIIFVMMILFAVVPASAEQGVGTSPYVAHLLTNGLNVGALAPGQSFWYSYSRSDLGGQGAESIVLNLVFKPGDSRTARQVTFDVYTFEQVKTFLETEKPVARKAGTGQLVASDYDPDTGERLWAGAIDLNEVYYIHVKNDSTLTVDYRLTALAQQVALPMAPANGAVTASTAARTATRSKSPAIPPLDDSPASSQWLLAAEAVQGLSPEDAAAWLKNAAKMGWLSDVSPAERVAAAPSSPKSTEAVVAGIAAEPDQNADNSIYPNRPLALLNDNTSRLAPHAEHWYSFLSDDLDEDLFEEMSLTLFHTPGEGNTANRVNMELFTGDQYHIWERGTPDAMRNFGAGQRVSRDKDPDTGEQIWRGWVVDGDRYYIKVKNDNDIWIDYYLKIGDIINAELGGAPNVIRAGESMLPSERIVNVAIPQQSTEVPGESIASPVAVTAGITTGSLDSGSDVWYAFRFRDFEQVEPEIRRYTMYLKHTPGLGYVANHVNLELYTYPELDLWLRGDADEMVPMGVGSREEYDKRTNTQEFTWDGPLISETTYFLRVRNDSEVNIFYQLDIQRR